MNFDFSITFRKEKEKSPTVSVKMFPDVEELGRGDLGQVQVRRLLCFIRHDALDGCCCRQDDRKIRS